MRRGPAPAVIEHRVHPRGEQLTADLTVRVCLRVDEAKIVLLDMLRRSALVADALSTLAAAGIAPRRMEQRPSCKSEDSCDLLMTVAKPFGQSAVQLLTDARPTLGFSEITLDDAVGRMCLTGVGMRSHSAITARFLAAFAAAGARFELVSISSAEISAIVAADDAARALACLRQTFGRVLITT